MVPNVEVIIVCNDNDIKQAISFYILRICSLRVYAFIAYTIVFMAIAFTLIFSEYAPLIVVFFICGVIIYNIYYQRPIQGYLKVYRKRESKLYRFNSDKVFVIGEEAQTECLWSVFKEAYEIPSAFLLIDENKFVYVFPKRCFSGTLIIEQMRELLAIKFPKFKGYNKPTL